MNAPLERIKVPVTDALRLAMTPLSMATPAKVAYRLACKQGERGYQRHAWIHQTIPENVAAVLGATLSPAAHIPHPDSALFGIIGIGHKSWHHEALQQSTEHIPGSPVSWYVVSNGVDSTPFTRK